METQKGHTLFSECPFWFLFSEFQFSDNCPVAFNFGILEVSEQASAFAYQFEKSLFGGKIFFMHLQVFGQIVDAVSEQSNLGFGGACVGRLFGVSVLLEQVFFNFGG
jgi:hypothetical protein